MGPPAIQTTHPTLVHLWWLFLVIVCALALCLVLAAVIDAARWTDAAFCQCGHRRGVWVLTPIVALLVPPVSVLLAIVYFVTIQPDLRATESGPP